eukprot:5057945-Ditylum_brightwellii.AAC.1
MHVDIAKTAYKVKDVAASLGKDNDRIVICIPVKNIKRNWSFQNYKTKGEFSADLFIPKDGKINGCVFFMYGFFQCPIAYYTMLKNTCNTAGVAILAVNTGLTFDTVLSKNIKANFAIMSPHFLLQHTVLEYTKQLIQMLQEGD